MAKIEFNDFDEYLDKLQKLEKDDVVPIMRCHYMKALEWL